MNGRRRLRAHWLYARAVAREFRYSLLVFLALLALGVTLFRLSPLAELPHPTLASSLYGTLALLGLGQPYNLPEAWYLRAIYLTYPALGIGVVVQALVRFGFLLVSKHNNEKEWMRVLASTYRNHVIVCGLGQVGFRVVERLLGYRLDVVAIEKDPAGRHVAAVKALGIPVIEMDVKQDESLVQAGIARARAIVIATNDDLANLEVALDARRMNPGVQVVMRMFDQDIAQKIGTAFGFERTFSSAALAAPAIAALALQEKVLGSCDIGGRTYITAEITVQPGARLAGTRVATLLGDYGAWVITRRAPGGEHEHHPPGSTAIQAGDVLVVQAVLADLHRLSAAARGARAAGEDEARGAAASAP